MMRVCLAVALLLAVLFSLPTAAQTAPYNRTVIVPSTGAPTTDGAALLSALSSLSPAPSYTNRWIIQLEGGIYDVGTTPVVLQQWVDLAGAGSHVSVVRGNVGPTGGSLLAGLVKGSSNSEIHDLTIQCLSNASVSACQALELNTADARLVNLTIQTAGTGSDSHWGIRTYDSSPVLDHVEISVNASNSFDNYGAVFGGASKLDMTRSSIDVRNASRNNWAILLSDDIQYSTIRDTKIRANGGYEAAGIRYLNTATASTLTCDNVDVISNQATKSLGIGTDFGDGGFPTIYFRTGSIYGLTQGVDHQGANVYLVNTDVYGGTIRVSGNVVRIGGTWLRGSGLIAGFTSLVCAGTFDGSYTFYPSTCPP